MHMFQLDLHNHDSEKGKIYEWLEGKSYGRIMDSRIIFEDRFARWLMECLEARKVGIDVWPAGLFLLRIQ